MALAEPGPGAEDVVDLLTAQHEQVKSLFAALRNTQGDAATEPFDELRKMLAVHETAEEMVVYPVVRRLPGGDDVVQARLAEESEAKTTLADLEKMGPASPQFPSELAAFEKAVLAHAEAEEHEIFPRLRQETDPDQRRQMAQALRAAEATAPTHAHKGAPQSAVGNLVVGPFVAMVDRVRDAIREHSKES